MTVTPQAHLGNVAVLGLGRTGEAAARYNDESARFREKWKEQLEAGDPYYNPNFSLDKSDFSLRV